MLLTQNTYNEQALLASYCRTGDETLIGKVDKTRTPHYRRLVFNNVKEALNAAYPLTKMLLDVKQWNDLIEEFFSNHTCQSKKIWELPKELKDYVNASNHSLLKQFPQLWDLLQFEWIEVALYMSEDVDIEFESGDMLRNYIIVNPELSIERFDYPVHIKKAKDIYTEDKGIYFLSVHRHPESGKVLFTNLSPVYVRLIDLLLQKAQTLDSLLYQIMNEFSLQNTTAVKKRLTEFLEAAYQSKLILGFQKNQ